jgi:hypothetical protein
MLLLQIENQCRIFMLGPIALGSTVVMTFERSIARDMQKSRLPARGNVDLLALWRSYSIKMNAR